MSWGQLELDAGDSTLDEATQESVAHKIEQLRQAQEAGQLEPDWDPIAILAFVNQIAMAWAAQPFLLPPDLDKRASFMADRRACIVAAVERLFPATCSNLDPNQSLDRPDRS
jgi:hypothetical protein